MNTIIVWALGLAAAFGLAAAPALLDGPSDIQAERDMVAALELAQRIDATQERMAKTANAMCRAELGPNAGARWTEDQRYVCITRRGERTLAAQQP